MLVLFTDTDTDLTPIEAKKYGYHLISMPYTIGEKEVYPYVDFDEFDYHKFYESLRKGNLPKTSAISVESYKKYFEPHFINGDDILYVHFSQAMSGTFNAMHLAVEELQEIYPDRKIYTIDTKGITICSLNIVKSVGELYLQNKSIDEILAWASIEVDKYATYFYADSLKFFKRSGRVSNISATMGDILGIHPIIYMNAEGKMVNINKCRGKKKSLAKLVEYVIELGDDVKNHRIIIGHADALDIAEQLANMLKEKLGEDLQIEYAVVNPTAGSHCGPDTIGISFHAIHR